MTVVILRFPSSDVDDPALFRVTDGVWQHAGLLSEFMPSADDETVMAVVSPADVRCSWFEIAPASPKTPTHGTPLAYLEARRRPFTSRRKL